MVALNLIMAPFLRWIPQIFGEQARLHCLYFISFVSSRLYCEVFGSTVKSEFLSFFIVQINTVLT